MSRALPLSKNSAGARSRFSVGNSDLSRRAAIRLAQIGLIVLFVVTSVFAYRATLQKQRELSAAHDAAAWRANSSAAIARESSANAATLDGFVATWRAQRASTAGTTTLTWTVADARDLRTSLLSLDATNAKTQRVDVVRREAGFSIVAELLQ
jgi:hypothetical protein